MKEQLEELLEHHRMAWQEAKYELEEMSKLDTDKMGIDEVELYLMNVRALSAEENLRKSFIDDLENLL